jgi:hypothetical protein
MLGCLENVKIQPKSSNLEQQFSNGFDIFKTLDLLVFDFKQVKSFIHP